MSDPRSILVVEDDAAVARSIAAYFSDYEFTCTTTPNGAKGLELFSQSRPDVLLVDLHIPGLTGLDLLRQVRAASPETPVIVISGSGTMEDVVQALRLGAWDFLIKPIAEMSILKHSVERSLERARLIRENRLHREHLEEEVRQRTSEMQEVNQALEQKNVALREVLKSIQEEKSEVAKSVVTNVEKVIMPMLGTLRAGLLPRQQRILSEVETSLTGIVSPFVDRLSKDIARLSPTELRVAAMIRRGLSIKEVASLEHISPETVATHRRAIRRKLGITNSKLNLTTYLEAKFNDLGSEAAPAQRVAAR